MHAVTIVARNYLPMAKVLAASFLSHHPDGRFSALLIDGDERDRASDEQLDILLVDDLGLPREEWRAMAAMYSVTEYATALKPATLRHLLGATPRGHAVAYLDPDILVFAPLDDVFAAAVADDIVLTPHVTRPMPRDGRSPDEEVIRHAGIFNLGFVCVGHEAMPFLNWWHERLVTDAVVDLPRALFTDQRWMDWVPALFRHRVLQDRGLNAAYWNLHERPLARTDGGSLTAGGAPLRFFHFSGFDPRTPTTLSRHGGSKPRVVLSEHPLLRELCAQYAGLLAANGFGTRTEGYGREHSVGGQRLTTHVRTAYRRSLLDARTGLEPMPPDPFETADATAFERWLTEEVAGPPGRGFNRWELAIYEERVDLQVVFHDHLGRNAAALRRWLDTDPYPIMLRAEVSAGNSGNATTPPRHTPLPATDREPIGINVVGYHAAELGVGEAARRMALAIDHVGLPSHLVGVAAAGARHQQSLSYAPGHRLRFRDTLYCINADETVRVTNSLEHADRQRPDARRFGLWFWELGEFPTQWSDAFELFEEVWVSSEFTRAGLVAVSPVPVRVVPLPVTAPSRPTPYTREVLGLPHAFLFSTAMDFHSVAKRKNPFDVVAAYTAAFGPDDGAHLLVKSINGSSQVAEMERLRAMTDPRADITVVDAHWSHHQMQALIELGDCFVSLHRSEGFGLNLASAMAANRPVIATGYSGNMDFMSDDTAFIVPYELVEVGADAAPYSPTAVWAQPDVAAAAGMMRAVFDNPVAAAVVAGRGREHVLAVQSVERAAAAISSALLPELFPTSEVSA